MYRIAVFSKHHEAGKTRLILNLLREFPKWAVIRVEFGAVFSQVLWGDGLPPAMQARAGQLKAAGAGEVIWMCADQDDLDDTLNEALCLAGDAPGVILEGDLGLSEVDAHVWLRVEPPAKKSEKIQVWLWNLPERVKEKEKHYFLAAEGENGAEFKDLLAQIKRYLF